MIVRSHDRANSQARPVKISINYSKYPFSSVLCEYGDTKVICSVSVENRVPQWVKGIRGKGWISAEYSLIPSATPDRVRRERNGASGRTLEIQRLVARSLRSAVDLNLIGERTLIVDCDVIQADGATRTASITGGWVALKLAIDKLLNNKRVIANPLKEPVAGVSVGIVDGEVKVDLDYEEDQRAAVRMHVVGNASGEILEVMASSDSNPYTRDQMMDMLKSAQDALVDIFDEQNRACEA